MNNDWNDSTRHDLLGALKTAGLVVVLFGAMAISAISLAQAETLAGADASCAPGCRTQHNACRLQSKGAPRCDGELQACVTRCVSLQAQKKATAPHVAPATAATLVPAPNR
jgi:hypothetical protein